MGSAALDVYVRTFLARCGAMLPSGRGMLDEPGIHGLLPYGDHRHTRLLVTDNRARDLLTTLIGEARSGMITVCAGAGQCAALLAGNPAWQAGTATAMISRDLDRVPTVALPCGLTLRRVRRLADDTPAGVPLTEAVAAASRADPGITDPQALADHLRSLPRAFGLWAAVDDGGVVRATSGSAAFEATASVIFVNTDPDWRRRGIARAMTAIALRAAQQAGARHAGIDASDAGRELYRRLGFENATAITRFRSSL
jgi:ribosomal protein S18 acetylase RimI-like enzyme